MGCYRTRWADTTTFVITVIQVESILSCQSERFSYGKTMHQTDKDGYWKFGMYTQIRKETHILFDNLRIAPDLGCKTLVADGPALDYKAPTDDDSHQ